MSWNYGFRPYVSVAERRRRTGRELAKLAKKGLSVQPIQIEGRTIATSFWGKAWCDNLESYMDYANRLPRGRTYVRNGSVVHLEIASGTIQAMVAGSELYRVKVAISPVSGPLWKTLCRDCSGGIGSLVELLQGRLSDHVMGIITRKGTGLFPNPREIKMSCSCPDWAGMCKHIAATLYAIGSRLDQSPELLFLLRSVNHEELITQAAAVTSFTSKTDSAGPELSESELGDVFGIELDSGSSAVKASSTPSPAKKAKAAKSVQPTKRRAKRKAAPRSRRRAAE